MIIFWQLNLFDRTKTIFYGVGFTDMTEIEYQWLNADPKNDPYGTRLAGKPLHAVYADGRSAAKKFL
jgi:hypothetical protein